MTFYDILGVSRFATQEEIRSAYRELARRYHPDQLGEVEDPAREQAEENIKAINAAWQELGDPARRRAYHEVMWTIHDPARRFRFTPPKKEQKNHADDHPVNGAPRTRSKEARAAAIYLEILQTRKDREILLERQASRRRRLWMSAGFTSLLVYFLIYFGSQLFPSPAEIFPLTLYYSGAELIALAIIFNASGMQLARFPLIGNPVGFSLTVTLGALVTCSAVPRLDLDLGSPTSMFSSLVISAGLLIHLYLSTRLARLQDEQFGHELRRIDTRLRDLERRWSKSRREN